MIGYICKYTPIEIFTCFDKEVIKLDPSGSAFQRADVMMHPNMCAYSKAALETLLSSDLRELLIVNCCDSIKRLYDVLKSSKKFDFLYLLDVPRKADAFSIAFLRKELNNLILNYEAYSGMSFNTKKFAEIFTDSEKKIAGKTPALNLTLSGARYRPSLLELIQSMDANISDDFTCTGISRNLGIYDGSKDILTWYAENLLKQFPCMRMTDINVRKTAYKNLNDTDGIIYHTIKFCDNYSFDYADLIASVQKPILKIETDYSEQCEGQLKTRIEAFTETLRKKNVSKAFTREKFFTSIPHNESGIITAGIDSGSTSTNVVILNDKKEILSFSIVKTGSKSITSAENAFSDALKKAGITRDAVKYIVSTGYGRVSIPFADLNVTEITCHGKGAYFLNSKVRTIIDIGGQDSKVIRLNDNGDVIDFVMNDKCAAGTGRFLEMMSRTLEIPLDKMGLESQHWSEQIAITSICTVFAESEVVSLVAQNKNKADIIHGLNSSISGKVISMLERLGRKSSYMMSGGVAKNTGVVKSIEEKLKEDLFIYDEPEIVGALGAALTALENLKK